MADVKTSALIVGGGMVGATLAIGLAKQGKQVTVVDPQFVQEWRHDSGYDLRISAVTNDNIQLLEQLGVWSIIQELRVFPFHQLAVSDTPKQWLELGEPNSSEPLGYMIENKVMQHALFLAMSEYAQITLLETSLNKLSVTERSAMTAAGQRIDFDMVFGCDGGQSLVRSASGIGVAGRDYGQRCLLSIVATDEQVPMRTWELFQGNEIHALLPLANKFACCILYGNSQQITAWQQDKQQLSCVLKERFSKQIGNFDIQNFASFPLIRQSALRYVQYPTVLVGDAAHTIHPMAGQGVNLGFRDVKALLAALEQRSLSDPTALKFALQKYQSLRRLDNEIMAHAMDAIGWGFKQESKPMKAVRTLMLKGFQAIAPARNVMTAYASGVWKL